MSPFCSRNKNKNHIQFSLHKQGPKTTIVSPFEEHKQRKRISMCKFSHDQWKRDLGSHTPNPRKDKYFGFTTFVLFIYLLILNFIHLSIAITTLFSTGPVVTLGYEDS